MDIWAHLMGRIFMLIFIIQGTFCFCIALIKIIYRHRVDTAVINMEIQSCCETLDESSYKQRSYHHDLYDADNGNSSNQTETPICYHV